MNDNSFGPRPTPEDATARWLRRGALYLLAPLLLILEVPVAIHVAQDPTTGMAVRNLTVRSVTPDSPAARAGVRSDDRILATRLGDQAVRSLDGGSSGVMAGVIRGELVLTPFEETYVRHKAVPESLLDVLQTMAS